MIHMGKEIFKLSPSLKKIDLGTAGDIELLNFAKKSGSY